jgi:hypothetical protein
LQFAQLLNRSVCSCHSTVKVVLGVVRYHRLKIHPLQMVEFKLLVDSSPLNIMKPYNIFFPPLWPWMFHLCKFGLGGSTTIAPWPLIIPRYPEANEIGVCAPLGFFDPLGFAPKNKRTRSSRFEKQAPGGFGNSGIHWASNMIKSSGASHKWGYPKNAGWGISYKIQLTWMIWGYPHFRKPSSKD